jgi:hypothetical protein
MIRNISYKVHMTAASARRTGPSPSWLLLAYQLPSRPSNARVATWRRLQRVGAVQVHGSVYVLPATAETREDLEWIAEDVIARGGQAALFVAETTEARARDEIVEAFRRARAREYEEVRVEAESVGRAPAGGQPAGGGRVATGGRHGARGREASGARGDRAGASGRERAGAAARLRERLAAIEAVDFFVAAGREEAAAAVAALERDQEDTLMRESQNAAGDESRLDPRSFRDRDWVTRPRPGIDRMSTAWLVRRFIDPEAAFRFVDAERRATLAPSAVPFDMAGVELGHQRGGCTFETVARRFGIGDPTVAWLGRIIHQLDLKTAEPVAPEAGVVGHLVEGLRRMYPDDHELLEQGIVMFEALFRSESERRAAAAPGTGPGKSAAAKGAAPKPAAKRAGAKSRPARNRPAKGGSRSTRAVERRQP